MNRIKRGIRYITSGRILLLLKVDKYMDRILFAFGMAILVIAANLAIESTVHRCEKNKELLEGLYARKIEYECELTSLHSIRMIRQLLVEEGSSLDIPEKPAQNVN